MRTHLTWNLIRDAKVQTRAINLLLLLKHSYGGQPNVYELQPRFVAPAKSWRTLPEQPAAALLESRLPSGNVARPEDALPTPEPRQAAFDPPFGLSAS